MNTLKRIEDLGYQPSFFKFAPEDAARFHYYTFETPHPEFQETWYLIGVHLSEVPAWHLELQLLMIEDDAPDKPLWDPNFRAPADAQGGWVYLDSQQYAAFLSFFEQLGYGASSPAASYFTPLTKAELTALHFPRERVMREQDNYYRYIPDLELQSSEMISLVSFPKWVDPLAPQQEIFSDYLSFETFHRDRLRDLAFHPWYANWGGYMHFNGDAWQEFLGLYRKHCLQEPEE
ncbi:MAG: hypothetical protein M3Y81_09990 [Chloroflexota bacterium]|nr:hypothetical protein [Chloroflexota bacterium]